MAFSKVEQIVYDLARPIAIDNDSYVYDVEYVKEGGSWFLKVYVDKEDEGITLDECEVISRSLNEALDKHDVIKQNYYLEVSSPGIERKLKTALHFEKYIGEMIDIGLYKPIKGSKNITAKLLSYKDNVIKAELAGEEVEIMQNATTYVKLHFDF